MTRSEHAARPRRESLAKRLGRKASQIKARDGHCCVYCGADEASSGAHLHLDHLTPRICGGADVPANLVTACRRCNTARGAMSLAQWRAYAAAALGLEILTPVALRGLARRRLPEAA